MASQNNETLDPVTWLAQVRRLADGVHTGGPAPEHHIRKAYHLVRLAPEPLSRAFPDPMDEGALEAMLAAQQYEAAALSVVGPRFADGKTAPRPGGDRSMGVLAAWTDEVLNLESQPV